MNGCELLFHLFCPPLRPHRPRRAPGGCGSQGGQRIPTDDLFKGGRLQGCGAVHRQQRGVLEQCAHIRKTRVVAPVRSTVIGEDSFSIAMASPQLGTGQPHPIHLVIVTIATNIAEVGGEAGQLVQIPLAVSPI